MEPSHPAPLRGLLPLLDRLPAVGEALDALPRGGVVRLVAPGPGLPWALALLAHRLRLPILAVVPTPEEARQALDALTALLGEEGVRPFPEPPGLPWERLEEDDASVHARLLALADLAFWEAGAPPRVVVASAPALLLRLPAPERFRSACLTLAPGLRMEPADLARRLSALGYRPTAQVDAPGTFARRGGILDLWHVGAPEPVRLEFFGDEVESLRVFDPATQRSTRPVNAVRVLPARFCLPTLADPSALRRGLEALSPDGCTPSVWERVREDLARLTAGEPVEGSAFYAGLFGEAGLWDFLPPSGVLAVGAPLLVEGALNRAEERASSMEEAHRRRGELPAGLPAPVWSAGGVRSALANRRPRLDLLPSPPPGEASVPALRAEAPPAYWGQLETFALGTARLLEEGARVVVVSRHAPRLREVLEEQGVLAPLREVLEEPPPPRSSVLVPASLPEGFRLATPEGPLVVLTDREIFARQRQRPSARPTPARTPARGEPARLADLTPGTYVVHPDHGIGRFVGVRWMDTGQGPREFLVLEYAEGARLYLPTERVDRLTLYRSPTDRPPALSRLGSGEWARTRERARRAVREMARELLELYASRQTIQGFAFSPDTPWQRELEDSFPYEETPDQVRVLEEVKRDMEAPRPMDRLVCGDVGFGKTEIALRCAFKAVMDGKQVAVLVPTTELAQQHYATFTERLAPYPVRVEVLSRLRSTEEQRRVLEGLRKGEVDIVIGTHRLLQKDVAFRDLGLVIIDDEHRFGVAHKERLKQMRREVDVLTLSATPIPRTLYMALAGLREMSVMETPPGGRAPVRTYLAEWSEEVVRSAIQRELDRGGQVFYLHNRVETLARAAEQVQRLVPSARVAMAHGRMEEEELARVVADFSAGRYDVLVCTTIVEAGLDIPSANTILIERADRLGLAQLYQLRGRVGRGDRQGFCYLLVPKGARLTEQAQQRLQALLSASELGSGLRIALKDLEVRGAGNLLGPEQSGHMHAVGFELYMEMLRTAVAELQGAPAPEEGPSVLPSQVAVDLPVPAYLPPEYVPDLGTRLSLYQRMAGLTSLEEVQDLEAELRDRFGPLPEPVQGLLWVLRLKVLAGEAGVASLAVQGQEVVLRMAEPLGGAGPALQKDLGGVARVGTEQVRLPRRGEWQRALEWVLRRMAHFRRRVLAGLSQA